MTEPKGHDGELDNYRNDVWPMRLCHRVEHMGMGEKDECDYRVQ